MQVVTPNLVSGKKVLLRYDIDVPIQDGKVTDDFRLKAGLPTLKLCLEHGKQVILMGHIGRPDGREVPELSVAPIYEWLKQQGFEEDLKSDKLRLLENLRFENWEDGCDLGYAKELASFGDVYINEAFAAYHPAASTTLLPKLLPHAAGLRFANEVKKLSQVRENPKRPLVIILGGAKIEDKLPAIRFFSSKADTILVGGKLVHEIKQQNIDLPQNVLVGNLSEDGLDIKSDTLNEWENPIKNAKMIVWNGPLGKIQDTKYKIQDLDSARGTYQLTQMILQSSAEVIIGGGDTVGFLKSANFMEEFEFKGFISTGGGAMLKFLLDGDLETINALT